MSGIMGGLLSSYSIDAPATLVYNLDAAALGGRVGTSITTSASFDGSTQYLTLPASTDWAFGTGDFTIEWWQYQTGAGTFPRVFSVGTSPTASVAVSIESGTFYFWENGNFTFSSVLSSYLTTWVHFAISRVSGQTSVYQNGTQIGSTYADTNNINDSSSVLSIGRDMTAAANTYWPGYISNFRIIKGTGIYTANFVAPTTTLRAVSGTVALLPLTAAPFMDMSLNNYLLTNTGTITTTTAAPALTTGTTDVTGTYTLTYSLPVATFTGSSTGTTLTVASGLTGTVTTGMTITGGSIPANTYIVNQLTGTTGSTGTYTISASVSQSSTSITGARITWAGTQGGIFSNYFSGDGIAAYITGGPNIGAATKYTVMMAYKLNVGTTANYGRLLNSNTASPDWLMGGYSNYPKAWFSNGVTINLTSAARDTVWHIDFVTFTKTVGNIYSSTTVQPTSTPTYTNTSSTISGFNQLKLYSKSDGNECAAGNIGMVKVWTGVLSTAQMQAQYAAYKARFGY